MTFPPRSNQIDESRKICVIICISSGHARCHLTWLELEPRGGCIFPSARFSERACVLSQLKSGSTSAPLAGRYCESSLSCSSRGRCGPSPCWQRWDWDRDGSQMKPSWVRGAICNDQIRSGVKNWLDQQRSPAITVSLVCLLFPGKPLGLLFGDSLFDPIRS